jgi:glyoxylase-like metal-dependent hydrolase (beta-lactamase superfamily II)
MSVYRLGAFPETMFSPNATETRQIGEREVQRRFETAVKFVVLGLGGFLILMFCDLALIVEFLYGEPMAIDPSVALVLAAASALIILAGTGQWGRWAYLWVFLSIPTVAVIWGLLSPLLPETHSGQIDPRILGMLVFAIPIVVSYLVLKRHYKRQIKTHIPFHGLLLFLCALFSVPAVLGFSLPAKAAPPPQTTSYAPDWCKSIPRPEYKSLKRVAVSDPWFEVYEPAPNVFAIYEPHQSEEVISYLIVGRSHALLFDTGMGISDIKKVVSELTKLPITVLNSHTHNDHVGGNWQFETIYNMDTDFTHTNAKGSREEAQAEITPDQICGDLPKDFNPKTYTTRPWKIKAYTRDGDMIDLGNRVIEVFSTPGHTPDAISLLDRANGLLFTGDTYYPAPIWLYTPETDLAAYRASIRRLADLVPQIKLVLGAHNIPVAEPSVLMRLVTAFDAVRSGKGEVKLEGAGKVMHTYEGFQFLFEEPKKGIN